MYSDLPPIGYRAPESSPAKRQRARSEEPEGDGDLKSSDFEMRNYDLESNRHALPSISEFNAMREGSRPVKPLRRTGRPFTQTRSLPSGTLWSSNDSDHSAYRPILGTMNSDDDWSKDPTFDSPTQPLTLDMEF